jgi:hypothetical protein
VKKDVCISAFLYVLPAFISEIIYRPAAEKQNSPIETLE